jgi:hypothetical protein
MYFAEKSELSLCYKDNVHFMLYEIPIELIRLYTILL